MLRLRKRSCLVVPAAAAAALGAGCCWIVHYHHHHHHASAYPLASGLAMVAHSSHNRPSGTTARDATSTDTSRRSTRALFSHCDDAAATTQPTISTGATTIPPKARSRTTAADAYFQAHGGELPRPKVMHAILPPPGEDSTSHESSSTSASISTHKKNAARKILIIGDVHGCYDEMILLHQTAVRHHNDGCEFAHVILVGDLVNKGPQSIAVLRHVPQPQNWWAVRGNHDQGALRAALLGQPKSDKKYAWISDLTDADVEFLSELPYTLRIPREWFAQKNEKKANNDDDRGLGNADVLIVHAGLIPGVNLEEQTVETMITLREVEATDSPGEYRYYRKTAGSSDSQHHPWASVWKGPETIVFGHDARRGLQQYDRAIGLDTGACYGKKLTGLILPDRTLVQVDALGVHCPIGGGDE